jgi:hypothetical protein
LAPPQAGQGAVAPGPDDPPPVVVTSANPLILRGDQRTDKEKGPPKRPLP